MTMWPPRKDELTRPAYRSLAARLIDAIDAGEVQPGTRLPAHRTLAYELGLSVQTVSRAYEELRRLGVVSGEVGRGSFVRDQRNDAQLPWQRPSASNEVIDCSILTPVTGQIHADRMSATLSDLAAAPPYPALFSFRPRATFAEHCVHAARWILGGGLDVHSDRILPTNGNTAAMTVAIMTIANPGDLVVTEELGHHTLKSLTAALGLKLSGLAIDAEGIVPEAFAQACVSSAVKVLFLMPGGLGPTAGMMGLERRRALIDIARQHDVWIIENDAWGPLEPERPPSIAALAPERTFYFTGLTKCLMPGLRLAWLVPPERMLSVTRTRHLVTHWMATPLIAEIASRWIEDGTAEELLIWQRENLARRVRIAQERLGELPHRVMPHGMHVWLALPEPWQEEAFVAHARSDGVAVAAGKSFGVDEKPRAPGVRICLGSGPEEDVSTAFLTLARLARRQPEQALLTI